MIISLQKNNSYVLKFSQKNLKESANFLEKFVEISQSPCKILVFCKNGDVLIATSTCHNDYVSLFDMRTPTWPMRERIE